VRQSGLKASRNFTTQISVAFYMDSYRRSSDSLKRFKLQLISVAPKFSRQICNVSCPFPSAYLKVSRDERWRFCSFDLSIHKRGRAWRWSVIDRSGKSSGNGASDHYTFRPRSLRSEWRKSLAWSYRAPPLAISRARGSTTLPTVSGPSRSAFSDHCCRRRSRMYSADPNTLKRHSSASAL